MRKTMLFLAVLGLAGSLWAADPFVGTWKLNLAKSKASNPNLMHKSETIRIVAQENGAIYTLGAAPKWPFFPARGGGKSKSGSFKEHRLDDWSERQTHESEKGILL